MFVKMYSAIYDGNDKIREMKFAGYVNADKISRIMPEEVQVEIYKYTQIQVDGYIAKFYIDYEGMCKLLKD